MLSESTIKDIQEAFKSKKIGGSQKHIVTVAVIGIIDAMGNAQHIDDALKEKERLKTALAKISQYLVAQGLAPDQLTGQNPLMDEVGTENENPNEANRPASKKG